MRRPTRPPPEHPTLPNPRRVRQQRTRRLNRQRDDPRSVAAWLLRPFVSNTLAQGLRDPAIGRTQAILPGRGQTLAPNVVASRWPLRRPGCDWSSPSVTWPRASAAPVPSSRSTSRTCRRVRREVWSRSRCSRRCTPDSPRPCERPRILCGDLNTPRAGSATTAPSSSGAHVTRRTPNAGTRPNAAWCSGSASTRTRGAKRAAVDAAQAGATQQPSQERELELKEVADASPAARKTPRVQPGEVTGYGSTATWKERS